MYLSFNVYSYCEIRCDQLKIVVMIPAYNEEESLGVVIEDIQSVYSDTVEIIVVDDGSKDKTKEVANSYRVHLVSHPKNQGLAKTFQSGIRRALQLGADIIVNFDADGQYLACDIPKLVEPILNSNADIVLGSRFLGSIEKMSKTKKAGNRMFSWSLRKITRTNISDFQTGFRAFTSHVAERIVIRARYTYTQEMIIDAVCKEFVITEVPIYFAKRKAGKSRLISNPFSYAYKSFKILFKAIRDFRPMLMFGLLGFFFILSGFALGIYFLISKVTQGAVGNSYLFLTSFFLIMFGIQSLLFGLTADMIITLRKDVAKIRCKK